MHFVCFFLGRQYILIKTSHNRFSVTTSAIITISGTREVPFKLVRFNPRISFLLTIAFGISDLTRIIHSDFDNLDKQVNINTFLMQSIRNYLTHRVLA